MANSWFRMYSEFADDPKVQMMSEAMQRRLLMLMCSKCKGETLHETELAFHWRISETEMAETKAVFLSKGFIDEGWNLLNWNKRQFISDSSTDRVRRHRSGKKQDETLHGTDETKKVVTVTPPEQIQNRTDTEQINTPLTPQGGITPEMVSRGVLETAGLSGRELTRILDDVCRAEMKSGRDPTGLREALVASIADYRETLARGELQYRIGTEKFIGEGLWKRRAEWPWKEEANAGNAAYLKFQQKHRNSGSAAQPGAA